jgi:porin
LDTFQHIEFVGPISGITPPMIFGGIISVKTKPAKFTLMIYDPESATMHSGFADPFAQGVTFNGSVELASNFFGKSGRHIFSAAYSTQDGTSFSDPYLLLPTTPSPERTTDRWYASYAFEQTLWRAAENSKEAVGLFGQASVSDASPNPLGWSVLGGISGTSPIPGRERDKVGVAAFYAAYAAGLKDGLRLAKVPARDETGMEVFYNFAFTPWLRVTADLQVVRPPRSDRDTALIGGLRAQVLF